MRVCYAQKIPKETETDETIRFFAIFLSLMAFQLGGVPPRPPLATPIIKQSNLIACLKMFNIGFIKK